MAQNQNLHGNDLINLRICPEGTSVRIGFSDNVVAKFLKFKSIINIVINRLNSHLS